MRASDDRSTTSARPAAAPPISKSDIEDLIARRVDERFAERALTEQSLAAAALPTALQKRLDSLEQRVSEREGEKASEGLQYLLMAKQHLSRGEEASALKMFELAGPWFPGNERLGRKIEGLRERIRLKREKEAQEEDRGTRGGESVELVVGPELVKKKTALQSLSTSEQTCETSERDPVPVHQPRKKKSTYDDPHDDDYAEPSPPKDTPEHDQYVSNYDDNDDSFHYKPKPKSKTNTRRKLAVFDDNTTPSDATNTTTPTDPSEHTPRTRHLLRIINTRDPAQIRLLKGVGAKKAQAIVDRLRDMEAEGGSDDELADADVDADTARPVVKDLAQLGRLKGVGVRGVENMRGGIVV